jgi:WhiB family transcriptional regulator, redox-sensing transcriptional regulator
MITAETFQQYTAPGWMGKALCKDADPSLFHPEPGDDHDLRVEEAKRYCRHCPVRNRCLEWAFETGDRWGILGGTTPYQRTRMRNTAARLRRKFGGDRKDRVRSLSSG